jgi:integrase
MKARDGAHLFTEHAKLLSEYEKIVAKAKRSAAAKGQLSPLEHWREAVKEAEALVEGITGVRNEDEARRVLADDLRQRSADPVLYRAVVAPDADEPAVTMLDAKEMYRKERMAGAQGRNHQNRLERIESSFGPLKKLDLVNLKREHARKLRDDMLATKKNDGSPLSPSSVKRELNMVRAMVSLAIKEHDLQRQAHNPFEGLEIAKADAAPDNEFDKRDPLPREVVVKMRQRMATTVRKPTLGIIWRLLEGTGCRGSEIVGLRVEDVQLDCKFPHIRVMWHEDRRVKTKVSIRSVPLIGDALEAAKEAVKLA